MSSRARLAQASNVAFAAAQLLSRRGKKKKSRAKLPTSLKHVMPSGTKLGKKIRMQPDLLLDDEHQAWSLKHLRLRATGPGFVRPREEEDDQKNVDPDAHLTAIERVRKAAILTKILCDSLAYQRARLKLKNSGAAKAAAEAARAFLTKKAAATQEDGVHGTTHVAPSEQ